jgi:peptidoglycan/LPS O-acetylase OafA/YrhL
VPLTHSQSAHSQNSYDFVRFCAASAVLFSHHFDIAGFAEPQVPLLGMDFGQLGVSVFFCLSGFLIAQSLEKSSDPARFFAARLLRIFPNLTVVLVVTSAAALLLTGNFAHLSQHVGYVLHNLAMFVDGVVFTIPGVLEHATRASLNDPLWTLPYELWCYVLLFVMFIPGGRRTRAGILALAVALTLLRDASFDHRVIGPLEIDDLINLASYFFAGAALSLMWRIGDRHALSIGAAGLIGLLLIRDEVIQLQPLALAACIIGLGRARAFAWFARGGDASYGMYVFAWPVQQLSLHLIGSFWLSLALAFVATVAIGYATWHGFEHRALMRREALAEFMQNVFRRRWIAARDQA